MPNEVTQPDENSGADQTAGSQTTETPGNAPDLAPQQVTPTTGTAATADVPTGTDAPAKQPAGQDSPKGPSSARQPVPTTGQPKDSTASQTPAPAPVDASAVFDQIRDLPPGELDALMNAIETELADEDGSGEVSLDEESTSKGRGSDEETLIGFAQLDPGSQKAIGAVHSHMVEQAVTAALDSDEELSYNMKQASPKAQESVQSIVRDRLQRMVDQRGDRFDYDWGTAAKQAVAAERGRLTPLLERPARPGMGPGSAGDHHVNRELTPPERVPAFADDHDRDEYLQERMKYNQALIEREQSNVPGA